MIHVVLMEPEHPANIGAVARIMKNFGFKKLVLVNPKCNINEDSHNLAKNAQDVLNNAKIANSIEGFDYVIGTTAIIGNDYNIPRTPLSPKELAEKLSQVKEKQIALLFGRESAGLSNEEIKDCDFIVNIPSANDYTTLNLSHAVGVLLYEIFIKESYSKHTPIGANEKTQILKMLDNSLEGRQWAL